jgi:hypothetical protein
MEPVCVASFNERPRIIELPDETLMAIHIGMEDHVQNIAARYSTNSGFTWLPAEKLLSVSTEQGRWGLVEALIDNEEELHLFLLNDRNTGVFRNPHDEGQTKRKDIYERRLDIWHCKTENSRKEWQAPKCIWEGYVGSINSVIQMKEGRIILPFHYLTKRTWSNRGEGLDAFWYAGQNSTTVIYSDDNGETWQLSPSELKVQTPSVDRYGAIEPVVLQLMDGRVWMLIRTQMGRFYESFSEHGDLWSYPGPTRLISSDSPAGMVRLPDNRIFLLWNKCLRFPYALGGRHVLHAAISEDDGKSWIGHREAARDPLRHQPPPPKGDHGTAYPYPAALKNGKVIITTGQGKGRISIILIDPDWLYEKRQECYFTEGFDEAWSVFGCRGVDLKPHPQKRNSYVLSVSKIHRQWPAAAVWNFPCGKKGILQITFSLTEGFGGANIMLSDHFSVPFDPEDGIYALFNIWISPEGKLAGKEMLETGRWYLLKLKWDCLAGKCGVYLEDRQTTDGKHNGKKTTDRKVAVIQLQHYSDGACYLRIHSSALEKEKGSLLVEHVNVAIEL